MNWSVQIDAKLSENGLSFFSEFSLKENLFLATYENLRKHANFVMADIVKTREHRSGQFCQTRITPVWADCKDY